MLEKVLDGEGLQPRSYRQHSPPTTGATSRAAQDPRKSLGAGHEKPYERAISTCGLRERLIGKERFGKWLLAIVSGRSPQTSARAL
jgi:hypothetical protein